jgi:transcriptional regulator with XRE-family HTH domain
MSWKTPPRERSIECNGEIFLYYRRQRGWTQQELADAAGFSQRLIAKAESGSRLSPETIDVLAQTLSTNGQTVYPEDLIASPRAMAAEFLRAYATHEAEMVSHCRDIFSPDLKVHFPGGPAAAPLSGVHEGIDAFDEFCHNFFRIFQRPDKWMAEQTAVFTAEGNKVIVAFFDCLANAHIPPSAGGGPVVLVMQFERGKLSSVHHLFDGTQFGQVVTMWRESAAGQVEMRQDQVMPIPIRDQDVSG